MSDFRTLRDALKAVLYDEPCEGEYDVPARLLDLCIVPPDALVALDVEAGAKALEPWDDGSQFLSVDEVRQVLTACGVHVPENDEPDEVVHDCEFHTVEEGGCVIALPLRFDGGWGRYRVGEKLDITITKRKEGE